MGCHHPDCHHLWQMPSSVDQGLSTSYKFAVKKLTTQSESCGHLFSSTVLHVFIGRKYVPHAIRSDFCRPIFLDASLHLSVHVGASAGSKRSMQNMVCEVYMFTHIQLRVADIHADKHACFSTGPHRAGRSGRSVDKPRNLRMPRLSSNFDAVTRCGFFSLYFTRG